MNELSKRVVEILKAHQGDTKAAINILFQMLGTQPEEYHEIIHTSILFAMESLHEWDNAMKYLAKWKVVEFHKAFINRMRQRVNQMDPFTGETGLMEETKRVIDKYLMFGSPKRQETVYKEPINIKKLIKNINPQSFAPKDQISLEPPPASKELKQQKTSINQKKQELVEKKDQSLAKPEPSLEENPNKNLKNEGNVWRGDSFGPEQTDSNNSSTIPQKKQHQDPLAAVTGRPPILKKKSLFDNNIKITQNSDNNDKNKDETAKGRIPNSKIFNIMKRFGDREENKSTQSWENFGRIKEIAPMAPPINTKVNEQFPADKFNFGSNKKGGDIDSKKISISPRKYDPNTKIVKIIRNEPPKQEKKPEILHEFSFASSEQKESQGKPQPMPTFKPVEPASSQLSQAQDQQFVFNDNAKESDKEEFFSGENEFKSESFKKLKEVAQTPMFMFDSKKRRSSGGIKIQEAFEVDEALNLYHADLKLRYYIKEIENRNGADTMTIFQEEFSKFLKDPELFRV